MSLFSSKPKDPIEEEMLRLQIKERELARQLEKLQGNPSASSRPAQPKPLVVIPANEDHHPNPRNKILPGRPRLRVEHRRAKTRFIAACILLAIVALLIYRVLNP
jgi:hypothetical protein